MALSESKAVQVINAYLNFCNEFKQTGEITDKNFNRIRFIKSCIGGQEEDVRLTWGDLFDEVYNLLENPEIKLRLDEESKEIEKLRLQKTAEKKSNQKLIQSIVSSSKQTNIRQSTINSDNIQKQKKRIIKKINGKYIEEKSIRNVTESGSSVSNDQKRKNKKIKIILSLQNSCIRAYNKYVKFSGQVLLKQKRMKKLERLLNQIERFLNLLNSVLQSVGLMIHQFLKILWTKKEQRVKDIVVQNS